MGASEVGTQGDSRGVVVLALWEGTSEVFCELFPWLFAPVLQQDEGAHFF